MGVKWSLAMIKKYLVKVYKVGHRFLTKHKIRPGLMCALNSKLISLLKSDRVEIHGYTLLLDPHDSLRLSTRGYFEPYVAEILQKKIKEGDVVVDIGANIGYHTLLMAKLADRKGKVYAFEPHPDNFALLKKNVEANGYSNVVLEQKAVSNKKGRANLYLDREDKSVKHSLLQHENTKNASVEVDSVTLDDYFKNQTVDFIKMDIEGAEHYALLGMQKLLLKNKTVKIILEFTPSYLEKVGIPPGEHVRLLERLGFQLKNINERDKVLEDFELKNIPRSLAARVENNINTNIFCSREL